MIKIVSDGSVTGTKVIDMKTGPIPSPNVGVSY